MSKLSKKDTKEIIRLRSLFPKKLSVSSRRSEDGGFVSTINELDGCITEANTFSELIEMVNDAVYTFFDVPEKFLSYMPNYVPPIEAAQRFNAFPIRKQQEQMELSIPMSLREKVNS